MPTSEQAKKAFEHGSKGKQYYDAMTEEQKKAMWQYGLDRGLISDSMLGPGALAEFKKYADPNRPEYRPQASIVVKSPKQYYKTQDENIRDSITPKFLNPLLSKSPKEVAAMPKIPDSPAKNTYPWDNQQNNTYPWDNKQEPAGVFAKLEKAKTDPLAKTNQGKSVDPLAKFKSNGSTDPLAKFRSPESPVKLKQEEKPLGVFAAIEQNENEAKKVITPKGLQPLVAEDKSKKLWDYIQQDKNRFLQLNEEGKKTYLNYGYKNGLLKPEELTDKAMSYIDIPKPAKPSLDLKPQMGIGKSGLVKPQSQTENKVVPVGKAGLVKTQARNFSNADAFVLGAGDSLTLGAFNKQLKDDSIKDHSLAFGAGQIAGYVAPTQGALKIAGKPVANLVSKVVGKKVLGRLATNIAEGAATGALVDTASGIAQGNNPKELLNRVGKGAALGAGIDVGLAALGGAGRLGKTIYDNIKAGKLAKIPIEQVAAAADNIPKPTAINSSGKFKIRNIALDNAINEYNTAIEVIQNHFKTNQLRPDEIARIKTELGIDLDGIVKKLETAEQGINMKDIGAYRNLANAAGVKTLPKINPPTLPTKKEAAIALEALQPFKSEVKGGGNINPLPTLKTPLKPQVKLPQIEAKNNKLPQSILNSDLASPELKGGLNKLDLNYNPLQNSDTLEAARKLVDTDYDKAVRMVKDGPATAESNTVGMELVRRLQNQKRYTEAIDIIENISQKATESGQAIQALSMWGRLTPEGMLKYTQRMFDKANEEITKQGFKDINKLKLTEDFAKDITERMTSIGSMAEGRAKTVEIAKVLRDIDEQLPKSVWRKVSTVQTMAQLLNPKTMIRNFAGNTIFGGLENISNVVATPIDKAISRLTGQRTTIMPSLKTQLEAGKVDLVEAVQDALMGIDTKGAGAKFELGRGATFKGNTLLGKLEKGMNVGLKATDAGFSGAARAESLRQQMIIAGVTEPTPGMIEIADKVAKYRTFQDKNFLSKGFKDIKDGLNRISGFFTGTTEWGLGDLVIKYATTPANILARGIDYSPLGGLKVVNEALKPLRGKVFNQKELVDALSRSLTGTGLIAAGYQLNKMGLITGAADKDKDVAALQRDIGQGEYKLNTTALGRYLTSFDQEALKPQAGDTYASWDWTAPTSIMLGIGANVSQNRGNSTDIITTIVNAAASGMNTIFEQPLLTGVKRFTGGYDQTQNLVNTLQGLPSSFVPSILNQGKQLTDNTTRNTYDPNIAKESINQVTARIPGLSRTLQPRITTLGKQKETFADSSNGLFNVLLNPSNTSKYAPTPGAEMVLDIYKKSGEKIQFPRVATTYIMDKGQKINLLPAEITKLQTIMGERTAEVFDRYARDMSFRASSPESQAKRLQAVLTEISQEARQEVLRDIRNR